MVNPSEKCKPGQFKENIKGSEEWFAAIFDGSRDAIFLTNVYGCFVEVNIAAEILTGYSKQELLRMSIPDLHDTVDLHAYNDFFDRIMAGEDIMSESVIRRKDGTHVTTEFSNRRIIVGQDHFMHTIARDISDRKQTGRKLQDSEKQYRNLVEHSPIGIGIYQDGRFVFINTAGLKIMGCTNQSEILGKPVLTFVHPESHAEVISRMQLVARGVAVAPLEETLIRLDGTLFYAEVTSVATTYNEKPAGQVLVKDISKRIKAEKELLESNTKYRMLSEQSGIGIGIYSLESKILFYNEKALQNLGGKSEDFIGKTLVDAFGEQAGAEFENRVKYVVKTGKNFDSEDYVKTSEGGRWFLSNHTRIVDSKGNVTGVQVVSHDITDQKRIENALKQASAYNRSLIEASLDPLVTIGSDGKILDVNKATQDITGYNRKKLIGTDFSSYFSDPAKAQAGYKEVFSSGFVRDYYLEIKSRKGEVIPVLYNANLYRDEEGTVTGVFAAARDISDLKRTEEKLKQSAKELRELSRHVEDLMETEKTQIAHDLHDDLGQKLTALNMDISWLKSRIGVQSRTVENKMQEMSQILNDSFESLRKISYGLRPSILDNLGLYPAIEWLLSEFKKSTGINYSLSFVPKEEEIDNKLSLVVFRIIQESLTNVARHSLATKVTVNIKLDSEKLKLIVMDNGIGFDSSVLKNRQSFGLLGMQERARSYGGELVIKGKAGKGTVVSLDIPVKTTQ
jgi:PAS domain S-box-containing protein